MILTVGRVAGYGLSFLRNLILARTLAKADYGLAAVFGMAMSLLELSGRMAFGQQLIQSKHGDDPSFQASAHSLQLAGGACSAVLIAALSVPMARLFHVPHAAWAFALLAVVPFSQGLSHLDISRRQRDLDYLPLVLVDVIPQFIITAAAWPLAVWLRDFRVIVWLVIAKAIMGTSMSFIFARRPYALAWERREIATMLSFGWPLLLTGLVMFGSQQVDQMLVGAVFSLNVLANYALAFSLVSIPWFIIGQVGSSLMLPLMARAQDDPARLRRQYRLCAQVSAVGGVLCLIPLVVSGEQITTLLYGAKYRGTGAFMALLGAAAAIRFLRFAPAVAALAKGDTINQLYSNVWRVASLPLALGVWSAGGTPVEIAGCAVAGEVLAAVVSVIRLWRRQGVPLHESFSASVFMVAMVSVGLAVALLGGANLNIGWAAAAAIGALVVTLVAARFAFPDVARFAIDALRKKQSGLAARPGAN